MMKISNIVCIIVCILVIILLLCQNKLINDEMKETALRDGFKIGREID